MFKLGILHVKIWFLFLLKNHEFWSHWVWPSPWIGAEQLLSRPVLSVQMQCPNPDS
jgi:hypothetical protein